MDWDNSYYTMSDENNYTIWNFLKVCHERGLLYEGRDVMTYSMEKKTPFKYPSKRYLNIIKQGYKDCDLDTKFLTEALKG